MSFGTLLNVLLTAVSLRPVSGVITTGLHVRVHDGSLGVYGGSVLAYPYTRKQSCGLQCTKTSSCWLWSHSSGTSVCKVYTSITSPMQLTPSPITFSAYGLATRVIEGYYVPENRVPDIQNAKNFCTNLGMKVAYEPDISVMNALHEKLGIDTIFIGLQRQNGGGDVWVDGYGNVVEKDSVNWEDGQPDNDGGNEDYALSFNSEVADIKLQSSVGGGNIPVICDIPKS